MSIFGLGTRREQRGSVWLAAWIASAAISLGQANTAAETPLAFEVASIKPHEGVIKFSSDPAVRGERVSGTASTAMDMITSAYGLRYDQIVGGPDWLRVDRYDVDAKAPGNTPPTPDQAKKMMQALLADRLQLRVHREMREVPIYALVVGSKGPKLKQGAPPVEGAPLVGSFVLGKPSGLHMEEKQGTMERLAKQLSNTAGRPVIDKTGLTGIYEFTLEWFPEAPGMWYPGVRTPTDADFPSMFSAVQELGLKLESSKDQQEMLVIDRVEKPSAN